MENEMEKKQAEFEQSVKGLFDSIEKQFPGVAEGMRVLNMSYVDYLTILQNSQAPTSFSASGTAVPTER
jgi:hypothetical protein